MRSIKDAKITAHKVSIASDNSKDSGKIFLGSDRGLILENLASVKAAAEMIYPSTQVVTHHERKLHQNDEWQR